MLFDPARLRNSYSEIRHGTSTAIEKGVIVSVMRRGIEGYGLSALGRLQVKESVTSAIESGFWKKPPIICASPFLRTRETAEIAAGKLGFAKSRIRIIRRLAERFFGTFEGKSNKNYEIAWAADALDWKHGQDGVESVFEMDRRVCGLILALEEEFEDEEIFLESHGDPLQVAETRFKKMHPSRHRSLPTLKPAEIRRLGYAAWK